MSHITPLEQTPVEKSLKDAWLGYPEVSYAIGVGQIEAQSTLLNAAS